MAELGMEKWPLCMSEAKKFVEELKLEYYSDPKRLTFFEALYILSTKVQLGPGLPSKISRPWQISDHTDEERVNKLLQRSLQVQMGRIENTEFREFILSNACLAVSGLMHVYLRNLGVESEIVSGVFCFSTKQNADGTPHVWLEIGGRPVENTFVQMPSAGRIDPTLFFRMKSEELYAKEDLNTTTRKLYFGEDNFSSESRVNAPHSLKVYTQYGRSENIEKFLVSFLKISPINPCVKMFDIVMEDYVGRDFEVVVEDLEKKWDSSCWKCETKQSPEKLKTCSGCKMAKYCGQECQKLDWNLHKILHKEINHFAASII